MKIYVFVTELTIGGAQLEALTVAHHLRNVGHDVTFVYNGRGRIADEWGGTDALQVATIPSMVRPVSPLRDIYAIISMYQLIRKGRPDGCVFFAPKAALLGTVAAFCARVPKRIYRIGGIPFNYLQSWFVRRFWLNLEKLVARLSTAVLFVSRANKRKALEARMLPPEKARVLHTTLNLAPFFVMRDADKKSLRRQLGLPEDSFIVLQVSSLVAAKRPMDLFEVARNVRDHKTTICFVLVGEGPEYDRISAAVGSHDLAHMFRLLGARRDVAKLMGVADVVTLTSTYAEGLPQVCAQALAAGVPLIAYDWEGIHEELLHSENGFLVAPLDIAGFATTLLALESNKVLQSRLRDGAMRFSGAHHEMETCMAIWQDELGNAPLSASEELNLRSGS